MLLSFLQRHALNLRWGRGFWPQFTGTYKRSRGADGSHMGLPVERIYHQEISRFKFLRSYGGWDSNPRTSPRSFYRTPEPKPCWLLHQELFASSSGIYNTANHHHMLEKLKAFSADVQAFRYHKTASFRSKSITNIRVLLLQPLPFMHTETS